MNPGKGGQKKIFKNTPMILNNEEGESDVNSSSQQQFMGKRNS
jgi:hypothetical protein